MVGTTAFSWFIKPIGAWPWTLCETTIEKIGCMILTVVSCFLICFLLIPCTLCTILVDIDLNTKIKMIGPVSFLLRAVVKQYIFITRSENIGECADVPNGHPRIGTMSCWVMRKIEK